MNALARATTSILVVDDHPTNRLVLSSLVRKHGYRSIEAADGAEALAMVRAERPQLVISDILMPTVDGFEFVRRLRADPTVADTRVIFCTATYREREAEDLARTGGVFRVLPKPCEPREMLAAITQALASESPGPAANLQVDFERDHIRLMTAKLSAQEAALRRAQRVAKLAHVVSLADGTFESWSETLAELAGVDEKSMPRSTREWLDLVDAGHRDEVRSMSIEAARTGRNSRTEYTLRRPDGSAVMIAHVVEPLQMGEVPRRDARWFSILQDITAQKAAEEQVRRLNADLEEAVRARTAELEAAMKELESFDYSISHDLRAPITRVRGFTAALLEDHAASLDEDGRDLLGRIAAAGERMEQMVNDLFGLSTVSRGELRLGHADLSALAQTVVAGLRAAQPERVVDVQVAAGLSARADSGLVRILLENLIGNAWKFTSRRENAQIVVGWRNESAVPVFFVRDSGAGFESDKASKLFAPFSRLHSKSEFDGTGIGLATVSRIVGRHGGRAWAEGAPDQGATFFFTLSVDRPPGDGPGNGAAGE